MSGTKPNRRPRVSLLSLLLLTAVVATSLTTAMLWSEVGPLRRENQRLRDEIGELTILDATKVHLLVLPTDPVEGYEWRWRVYVPPGSKYRVATKSSSQASGGFRSSTSGSGTVLEEGQHTVGAWLRPGAKAQWHYKAVAGGASTGGSLALENEPSGAIGMSMTSSSVASEETKMFDPDKPLRMLDARVETQFETPPEHEAYVELQVVLEPFR